MSADGRQSATTTRSAGGVVDGLNDAIRDNPLAAALVGAGVVWMLFGNARLGSIGGAVPRAIKAAAGSVGSVVSAGGDAVSAGMGAAGSQISRTAHRLTDGLSAALKTGESEDTTPHTDTRDDNRFRSGDNRGDIGEKLAGAIDGEREFANTGMSLATSAQNVLRENFQRQPLLLGALGLAVGAGLASAFPASAIEREAMGNSASAAKASVTAFATEAKDFAMERAKQVYEDVSQEAKAQGLTPSGAKDAIKDVTEKAKSVATSARDSLATRVSS